tara:strand:+ start:303 stop:560 length:258 start_codon:yes stop_codon:yes gene_type:complete
MFGLVICIFKSNIWIGYKLTDGYLNQQFEEYLAQGVIILRKILRPGGVLRIFSVEKMRGVDHDTQPHPYKIGSGGIEVYLSEIAL